MYNKMYNKMYNNVIIIIIIINYYCNVNYILKHLKALWNIL